VLVKASQVGIWSRTNAGRIMARASCHTLPLLAKTDQLPSMGRIDQSRGPSMGQSSILRAMIVFMFSGSLVSSSHLPKTGGRTYGRRREIFVSCRQGLRES
jgi:hypothetical protein